MDSVTSLYIFSIYNYLVCVIRVMLIVLLQVVVAITADCYWSISLAQEATLALVRPQLWVWPRKEPA